jgi:hypothetical protein
MACGRRVAVPSRRRAQPDACRRPPFILVGGARGHWATPKDHRPAATPKRPSHGGFSRSPDIEPENGTEEVEFEAFDPADRHTDVSGERDVILIHRPLW